VNYYQLVQEIQNYTENTFNTVDVNTFIEQAEQRIYNTVQFPSLRKNVTGVVNSTNPYVSAPTDYLSTYSFAVIDSSGNYTYLLNKDVNFIREAYPSQSYTGEPVYYAIFGPTVTSGVVTTSLSFLVGPTPNTTYTAELHYYYYPSSIIPGVITTLNGTFVSGSGYPNGTYYNQPLTGGTGSGATATIVVSSGVVNSITLSAGGTGYVVGDTLSISLSAGAGFAVTVSAINQNTGTTWLSNNYDPVLLYASLVEAYTFMKGEQDMVALYNQKYTEALEQAKRLGDALERMDAYRSGQYRQAVT